MEKGKLVEVSDYITLMEMLENCMEGRKRICISIRTYGTEVTLSIIPTMIYKEISGCYGIYIETGEACISIPEKDICNIVKDETEEYCIDTIWTNEIKYRLTQRRTYDMIVSSERAEVHNEKVLHKI